MNDRAIIFNVHDAIHHGLIAIVCADALPGERDLVTCCRQACAGNSAPVDECSAMNVAEENVTDV